jgi:hypothetical protein
VIAGFGDQREVELLVEAGFTPLEAIHIATANGALRRWAAVLPRRWRVAPGVVSLIRCMLGLAYGLLTGYA